MSLRAGLHASGLADEVRTTHGRSAGALAFEDRFDLKSNPHRSPPFTRRALEMNLGLDPNNH